MTTRFLCEEAAKQVPYLMQTAQDWRLGVVTLSETKGLSERPVLSPVEACPEPSRRGFFAPLRMTWFKCLVVKYTEVMRSSFARAHSAGYCSQFFSLSLSVSLFLCLPFPSLARAGHGFASAFGNIEWLPDPGRSPDSVLYRLDAIREESQLLLARTTTDKVRLCLTFAREKLAETEAMARVENPIAAATAAERYQSYLERTKQLVSNEVADKESLAEQFATALLEHQYILSVIYPELPVSTRAGVLQAITTAHEQYQEVAKLLPPKKKGALFFKEEEVRWSVDMATRADGGGT